MGERQTNDTVRCDGSSSHDEGALFPLWEEHRQSRSMSRQAGITLPYRGSIVFPLGLVLALGIAYNWYRNVDPEDAVSSPFGDPINVGLIILSLLAIARHWCLSRSLSGLRLSNIGARHTHRSNLSGY